MFLLCVIDFKVCVIRNTGSVSQKQHTMSTYQHKNGLVFDCLVVCRNRTENKIKYFYKVKKLVRSLGEIIDMS